MDSFHIAATGMRAHQAQIDSIANNVANINTVGFKRATTVFSTVVAQVAAEPTAAGDEAATAAPGRGFGAVASSRVSMAGGELRRTDAALDLAIDGRGFVEVRRADGSPAFTRSLQLKVDADGRLVLAATGLPLAADIVVPADALALRIDRDGVVSAVLDGEGRSAELGRILLVDFADPAGLRAEDGNLFTAAPSAGAMVEERAGEQGLGTLRQGFLEGANVQLIDELVAMLLAQRAFEMNSRVVQAADQMFATTNNLYRP